MSRDFGYDPGSAFQMSYVCNRQLVILTESVLYPSDRILGFSLEIVCNGFLPNVVY
jgi:hypothetical protein